MNIPEPNSPCPCCSGKNYSDCCGRYIGTKEIAPDAETVMRSRYTAYASGNIEHIAKTIPLLQRKHFDEASARQWSEGAKWLGLEVLGAKEHAQGKKARVEFKAKYEIEGEEVSHHEVAMFEKMHNRWLFIDSKIIEDKNLKKK